MASDHLKNGFQRQPCWGHRGTEEEESQAIKPQAEVKGNMSQFTAHKLMGVGATRVSVMLFPYARTQKENVKGDTVGDVNLPWARVLGG